jgi:hypothetical protein
MKSDFSCGLPFTAWPAFALTVGIGASNRSFSTAGTALISAKISGQ